MIGRYAVLATRIRHDLADLERVVERIERAVLTSRLNTADRDLLLDSAALNLHDFYTGLERTFTHIASGLDQSIPSGPDWHRELLRQMAVAVPGIRPQVISDENARDLDEFLRFRHVVRHIYAFELDLERVEQLTQRVRPSFREVRRKLDDFATLLEEMAREA